MHSQVANSMDEYPKKFNCEFSMDEWMIFLMDMDNFHG
jgi:hypothetical protein